MGDNMKMQDAEGSIHAEIHLEDCPYCGGPGLLEEENGWCWYVVCLDCGAQTAEMAYKTTEDRRAAARRAGELWNMRKVVNAAPGE